MHLHEATTQKRREASPPRTPLVFKGPHSLSLIQSLQQKLQVLVRRRIISLSICVGCKRRRKGLQRAPGSPATQTALPAHICLHMASHDRQTEANTKQRRVRRQENMRQRHGHLLMSKGLPQIAAPITATRTLRIESPVPGVSHTTHTRQLSRCPCSTLSTCAATAPLRARARPVHPGVAPPRCGWRCHSPAWRSPPGGRCLGTNATASASCSSLVLAVLPLVPSVLVQRPEAMARIVVVKGRLQGTSVHELL